MMKINIKNMTITVKSGGINKDLSEAFEEPETEQEVTELVPKDYYVLVSQEDTVKYVSKELRFHPCPRTFEVVIIENGAIETVKFASLKGAIQKYDLYGFGELIKENQNPTPIINPTNF